MYTDNDLKKLEDEIYLLEDKNKKLRDMLNNNQVQERVSVSSARNPTYTEVKTTSNIRRS